MKCRYSQSCPLSRSLGPLLLIKKNASDAYVDGKTIEYPCKYVLAFVMGSIFDVENLVFKRKVPQRISLSINNSRRLRQVFRQKVILTLCGKTFALPFARFTREYNYIYLQIEHNLIYKYKIFFALHFSCKYTVWKFDLKKIYES